MAAVLLQVVEIEEPVQETQVDVEVKEKTTEEVVENDVVVTLPPPGQAKPFVAEEEERSVAPAPAPPPPPPILDLFAEKSVNIEIYENMRTPAKILDLKGLLTNPKEENVIFNLNNNFGLFEVDQLAGHLVITNSPDREQRDKYALKIRAVKTPQVSEREVPVFFYTLYVQENQQALIGESCLKRPRVLSDLSLT